MATSVTTELTLQDLLEFLSQTERALRTVKRIPEAFDEAREALDDLHIAAGRIGEAKAGRLGVWHPVTHEISGLQEFVLELEADGMRNLVQETDDLQSLIEWAFTRTEDEIKRLGEGGGDDA